MRLYVHPTLKISYNCKPSGQGFPVKQNQQGIKKRGIGKGDSGREEGREGRAERRNQEKEISNRGDKGEEWGEKDFVYQDYAIKEFYFIFLFPASFLTTKKS